MAHKATRVCIAGIRSVIQRTRYPELSYQNLVRGYWRIVDNETGRVVGPHYASKAELLADLDRFARENYGIS